MKRYILIPLLIIAGVYGYYHNKLSHTQGQYRIAILTPVTHSALEEIISGFKETLQKNLSCSFEIFNAHGDRILLRNQAEKIVQDEYDLALVVATQPSIIMKEVICQRSSSLPIICAAVDDPVKNGLIASFEYSLRNSFKK